MIRSKKRSVFRSALFSWPAIIGLGVLVGYMAVSVFKVYFNVRRVALNQQAVKKETESLDLKKGELESVLERLETPAGIEEEIRKKFQVKKPGEEAIIVVEKPEKTGQPEKLSIASFFKKIWEFFK